MKPSTNYELIAWTCALVLAGSFFQIGPLDALQDRSILFVLTAIAAATASILREMGR